MSSSLNQLSLNLLAWLTVALYAACNVQMPTVYSQVMVTLDFAVTGYAISLLLPPADLYANQDPAILAPKPVYANGSCYYNA